LHLYYNTGKLPKPKPVNDLFRKYTGPVLIAQGALDPLNDAKSRARQFESIRPGVTVDLLDLGHCPMDEGPQLVAKSVIRWARNEKIVLDDAGGIVLDDAEGKGAELRAVKTTSTSTSTAQ
jgi:hypothetical protein